MKEQILARIRVKIGSNVLDAPYFVQRKLLIAAANNEHVRISLSPRGGRKTILVIGALNMMNLLPKTETPPSIKRSSEHFDVYAMYVGVTHEAAIRMREMFMDYGNGFHLKVLLAIGDPHYSNIDHSYKSNVAKLKGGVQIVCGTAGRMRHLAEDHPEYFKQVRLVLLDNYIAFREHDFKVHIDVIKSVLDCDNLKILAFASQSDRSLQPKEIIESIEHSKKIYEYRRHLPKELDLSYIAFKFIDCRGDSDKLDKLLMILKNLNVSKSKILIFSNRNDAVDKIHDALSTKYGPGSVRKYGGKVLTQKEREIATASLLRSKSLIAVGTDLLSQNIDIVFDVVINFDIHPNEEQFAQRASRLINREKAKKLNISLFGSHNAAVLDEVQKKYGIWIKEYVDN